MRVVIPLCGSVTDTRMMSLGSVLAQAFTGPVELLQFDTPEALSDVAEIPDAQPRRYREMLDRLSPDVRVRTSTLLGDPVAETLQFVSPEQRDILLLRSASGSAANTLNGFDFTANLSLIRRVYVCAVPAGLSGLQQPLRSLLVPLATSAHVKEIMQLAVNLARQVPQSRIHLVWILERNSGQDRLEAVTLLLDDLARNARRQQIRINWEVRFGPASSEILRLAATVDADLILMPCDGFDASQPVQCETVPGAVIRASPVPVLILPCDSSSDTEL